MDCQEIINSVYEQIKEEENKGSVASYIPELKNINPNRFCVHLITINSESYSAGDTDQAFSIQSIAKVLSLSMAINIVGEKVWERVDVEPSGNAFNSLLQLEQEMGVPRNPLINAGALVICDILISQLSDAKQEFLAFVNSIAPVNISYNSTIAESEKEEGFRNYALANYLKSFGNIKNDVSEVLDFYFLLCSIKLTCKELSNLFLYLSNNGIHPISGQRVLSASNTKRVNAIMATCGFYDEAGEFAYRVGLPGKSGVGGGIIAIYPGKYSVAVYSPRLNEKGNSYRGMKFLEHFTSRTESSIF